MDTWKLLEKEEGSLGRERGDVIGLEEDKAQMSEENGLVPRLECRFESWVLSEGWPSWSYVLKSLGCKDLHTVVKGLSLGELLEVRATGLNPSKVHSWTHVRKLLELKSASTRHMWIQGSREFIDHSIKLAKLYNISKYTCVIVEAKVVKGKLPAVDGNEWAQLNHGRLGGLTHGRYRVLSSCSLDKSFLYKASEVRPRLKHILRGKESGVLVADSDEVANLLANQGYISGDNLVVTGTSKVPVLSPSVFHSKSELVKRCLSSQELMDVYDVDVCVQESLLNYARTRGQAPLNTFVRQVPGKVLYRLALAVLQPEVMRTTIAYLGEQPVVDREERGDFVSRPQDPLESRKRSLPAFMPTDEPGPGPSATPSEAEVDLPVPRVRLDDENVKAAKNDDAKANSSEWNVRAASRFPGGYSSDTHDPMLELYRKACLRWYSNRVRKSFTSYLKLTYGENWYELAHGQVPVYAGTKRKRDDDEEELPPISLEELDSEVPLPPPASASQIGDCRDDSSDPVMGREEFVAMLSDPNTEGLKMNGYEKKRKELLKDLKVGRDAIRRAGLSSWWEWDAGSTLFFWRWPSEYKKDVRDGLEVCVEGQLPEYWARQRWPADAKEREQLREKLFKPVSKNYIARGFVKSLISLFAVLKGEDDIRIVYDATKSGLNEAIWAPNFYLPTVDSVLRNADNHTWYGDIDLGEMFLNYFLDEKLRPYAGVDVSGIRELLTDEFKNMPQEDQKRLVMRWERNLMGLTSSPYNSTRTFAWSEDFIRGDRRDPKNPLRWDRVVLNLPGALAYKPGDPDVYRYDDLNAKIAAFFETYVDDIRTGDCGGEDACHRLTHVIAARINYLGQQDSPRKRRKVGLAPGAWAGAMVISKPGDGLYVTCSQEKWDKARNIIFTMLKTMLADPTAELDRKQLERDRGFLIHICRTFTQLVPYLKGIHHTLESWRFGRDDDGWKFGTQQMMKWLNEEVDLEEDGGVETVTKANWKDTFKSYKEQHQGDAPDLVTPVGRLLPDLKALSKILEPEIPIHRLVRGTTVKKIVLCFGDASGAGFGSTWETNNGTIRYRYGLWGDEMKDSSSNLRELLNLVDTLEKMKEEGELTGTEVYVFTDNSTAELAFFKGTSKSLKLHDLVLRLRLLEGAAQCKIHFIHVAGKRMIAQGADGLSRGNLTEGVMGGWQMGDFVPLHQGALERNQDLEGWIRSWCDSSKQKAEVLEPEGWFEKGHDLVGGTTNSDGMWVPEYRNGVYIWAPPPAAAEAALEQLRKARQKRQGSCHVFICPRLMTPYWAKHLNRSADLITIVPPGQSFWPDEMYEPLIIGIYFPFLKNRPWQLKGQPALLGLDKLLRMLWKTDPGAAGPLLRKLWSNTRKMASMPKELVCQVLSCRQGLPFSNRKTRK